VPLGKEEVSPLEVELPPWLEVELRLTPPQPLRLTRENARVNALTAIRLVFMEKASL
jgi:hypothetical protein